MSKRVFLLGLGLTLVALALAVTDWLLTPPPTPGVTEANVKRLRPGMTVAEVEAILGELPRSKGGGGFGPTRPGSFGYRSSRLVNGGFGNGGFGKGALADGSPLKQEILRLQQLAETPTGTPTGGFVVVSGGEEVARTLEVVRQMEQMEPKEVYVTIFGAEGTVTLYPREDGRLKRAEWEPYSFATPAKAGLIGRLRQWLGW